MPLTENLNSTLTHNFSAGPAKLPREVLLEAQRDLLNYGKSGISVMEMSHRSKEFDAIAKKAEADLRELASIPDNYKVLFAQGGATSQFSMVPLNLGASGKAAYLDTGFWSKKAIAEAQRYLDLQILTSSKENNYTTVAPESAWHAASSENSYLHYTANETIHGVEFPYVPQTQLPLICDMSSNFLARPLDISKYALIYAGAQKNLGPAGVTLVIVRDDFLGKAREQTPFLYDYKTLADNASMANTPPTFAWYICGLVFQWLKINGGLSGMESRNKEKAELLYKTLDSSILFENKVDKQYRSIMNVPFHLRQANEQLEKTFLMEAKKAGLIGLAGHRATGGMRASLYNAVTLADTKALCDFIENFELQNK